jgi:uncharacterized protein YndB with AHSA1/START domain
VNADGDERRLRLERTLGARPERAFAAWVEPQPLSEWWCPAGFTVPRADLDVRVGECYRIEMQPPEGEPFAVYGEYREVDPPGRLAYTFEWDPPTADDQETLVEPTLEPTGEGTRLVLTLRRSSRVAREGLGTGAG